MWKVCQVESNEIVSLGFKTEEDAQNWLDRRRDLNPEDYGIVEMGEEEESEYVERKEMEEVELDTRGASAHYEEDSGDDDDGLVTEDFDDE